MAASASLIAPKRNCASSTATPITGDSKSTGSSGPIAPVTFESRTSGDFTRALPFPK